jgi:hypothetical protein
MALSDHSPDIPHCCIESSRQYWSYKPDSAISAVIIICQPHIAESLLNLSSASSRRFGCG